MNAHSSHMSEPIFEKAADRLFQDSIDPIIITDLAGSILIANHQAGKIFERDIHALIGQNIRDIHQEDGHLPNFSELPDESIERFDSLIPLPGKDKQLYVQVLARRYTLNGDDLVQWIHHDLTRQEELDKMRQDLTVMLVHDLQSPLGNVISSLEIVRNELDSGTNPSLNEMIDIAVRNSQYLQSLVESLLDVSHLEAGHSLEKLAPVDVNELIEYASAVQSPDFEVRNVTLNIDIDPSLPNIMAEINILRRVLLNLLNNALKHSQRGQEIVIKACAVDKENVVKISVIDQGPGIPEGFQEIIFEKFQRAERDSSSDGLGLGLAFCRLAVEAHGGEIWVENIVDGGACFSFTIPSSKIDPAKQ